MSLSIVDLNSPRNEAMISISPNRHQSKWRIGFLALVIYVVMVQGGIDSLTPGISTLLLAILLVRSAFFQMPNKKAALIWLISVFLAGILIGYAWLQSVAVVDQRYGQEFWAPAHALLLPAKDAISVAPMQTRLAILGLSPVVGFCVSLRLFAEEAEALKFLKRLNYFNAVLALCGILQMVFFPSNNLFAEKQFYVGSLTAVFINRNTAGTFFGLGLLTSLGLLLFQLKSVDIRHFAVSILALKNGAFARYRRVLVPICASLLQAIALFLTQSRGAVGATFLSIVLLILLMSRRRLSVSRTSGASSRLAGVIRVCAVLALVVGGFSLFAGRSIQRMEVQGIEDARWCTDLATVEAVKDYWPLGSGLGTFAETYPRYRQPGCGDPYAVWEAAHNTYLEGALTLGIVFAIVCACVYALLLFIVVYGLKNRRRLYFAPCLLAAAVTLVTLHGHVDFSLQIPGFALFFASVCGALTAISLNESKI